MRFHFNWFLVLALVACPAVWGQQEGEAKQDQAAQAAETQDDEKELTVAEKFREIQVAQRKMMRDLGNEFRDAQGDQAAQAEIMQQRLEKLSADPALLSTIDVYTAHPLRDPHSMPEARGFKSLCVNFGQSAFHMQCSLYFAPDY